VDAPSYYTVQELTELYPSIPASQWHSWSARGKIKTVKSAGRVILIPHAEVKKILDKKAPLLSFYEEWADKLARAGLKD
jgi:hypothetical protein